MQRVYSFQLSILLIAILSFTVHAFASSETNPAGHGGEGANTISGWVVSNVQYRLSENPSTVSSIEFNLDKPASVVKASVNPTNAGFFECQNSSGNHWACNINPSVEISLMNELRVVAVGME